MPPAETPDAGQPRAKLTFRSGGWVLMLAGVLMLVILGWRIAILVGSGVTRAVGDGRNPATYGFDLSDPLVPREQIVASGIPKDGLPALIDPPMMPIGNVVAFNETIRGKYLVPRDRVIGVEIGGQARAYPIRVLNWHEVINDTVGGVPVVVTYNPLCDSAVVFDRRMRGKTLEFGVSGLLYNSNLLMYDHHQDPSAESLWSQIEARAIAGPAARDARTLHIIPCALVQLGFWRDLHPDSEVLAADLRRIDRYKLDPYVSYYGDERLRFPVNPLPPALPHGMPYKTRMIVVGAGGVRRAIPLEEVAKNADDQGRYSIELGPSAKSKVILTYHPDPPTVFAEFGSPLPPDAETLYTFWFAWYAADAPD